MANHGVVTYGPSLMRAYLLMETVEHFARIALTTHLLGKQQPLNDVQMQKLVTLRECYLAADLPQTPSTQSPQANPGAVEGLKDRA
jgi:ribulose-5-phosphate 4-epimerase/fuculose-1-phosphate aldolase